MKAVRLAIAAAALLALGAGEAVPPAHVDSARMLAGEAGQWLATGRTYDEQRYSPLDQIDTGNVGQLGLAWFADIPTTRGVEATPLAIDGVLYNVEPWNIVSAYDGRNGKVLWRYDPQVPERFARFACCDIVSRGVAAWEGKIFVATLDGRLIALDAESGDPVWSVLTVDNAKPYTITGAPRVADGKVLIGNGGAELGVRGYVSAYDADSGELVWRWWTVPGNPADGFENAAMERAAETWTGEWWKAGGGGTVWDSMAYDPNLRLLYIGAGNGSPWSRALRSPGGGDNLYLSSIVALDIDTGEYRWHYQTSPGDDWDYTATQSLILADLMMDGGTRRVVMQAPKNGFFYVLDAETGAFISAAPFAPVNWAYGVDPKSGRALVNPAARYGTTPVMVAPSAGGAHNWNPMAFSPRTGLAYLQVSETYMAFAVDPEWSADNPRGTGVAYSGNDDARRAIADYADANSRAWLAAWDPVGQREVWRVPFTRNGSGGALATAGNLVFQGSIDTSFVAYHAETGEKLWEFPVQNVPVAGAISYAIDGEQYIAVNAGWGGGLAHVERARYSDLSLGPARLLVFKLGGKAQLPALAPKPPITATEPPPPSRGRVGEIASGERLYDNHCALCHGAMARGGIKDLRFMSAETRAQFLDIVLQGARARQGMASFADVLSREDAEAIHQYLILRANEDWETDRGELP